jgi:hypothetical protein
MSAKIDDEMGWIYSRLAFCLVGEIPDSLLPGTAIESIICHWDSDP